MDAPKQEESLENQFVNEMKNKVKMLQQCEQQQFYQQKSQLQFSSSICLK